jgi:PASTA domain
VRGVRGIAAAASAAGLLGTFAVSASSSTLQPGGVPSAALRPLVLDGPKASASQPARDLPVASLPSGSVRAQPRPLRRGIDTRKTGGLLTRADDPQFTQIGPREPAPGAALSFDGISGAESLWDPPDPNGDVGPNHYVQMVNAHWAVYDKAGNRLLGPLDENSLWQGQALTDLCRTSDQGDPIVVYDELADRWLLSFFAFNRLPDGTRTAPYSECIAVSQTPDPLGAWWLYSINLSSVPSIGTSFPDYPKFGVWPDAYYMSANLFTATAQDGLLVAFERGPMLNGQNIRYITLVDPYLEGNLLPADLDGAAPPAGAPGMFLVPDPQAYQLRLYRFFTNWGGTPSVNFANVPVPSYDHIVCTFQSPISSKCVNQPGTTIKLDPLDHDQLMFRLVYRNFGTHESLFASQTIDVANAANNLFGVAGVRWYEIRSPRTTPVLHQLGTVPFDATTHRFNPAIAADVYGNVAVGYNVSNATTVFPGIRYAARRAGDPAHQLPLTETTLVPGGGSKTGLSGERARWGDYSSMSVDPVDDCTFWFTGQYMPSTSDFGWRTRVSAFRISPCPGAGTPPPPAVDTTPPTDPNLSSLDHPVGVPRADRTLRIRWAGAADGGSGVDGFSYTVTAQPTTVPDTVKDAEENIIGVDFNDPLANGTYYFHLRTRDNAGNWSAGRHLGPLIVRVGRAPRVVRCRVPRLRGKTVARARRLLARSNCRLGKVRRMYSNRVRRGRIVKQGRRPGARLARGTRVNVHVSRGRRR